jgi:tRNA threonylcarbamoyl adenosine modification protein (Sua5/YciO/YrdC/YwlC family)
MTPELRALAEGAIVAAPSESFFGLLVDATSRLGVDNLLRAKAREQKGAPILLPDRECWSDYVLDIPEAALVLADAFWPGPLTIALAASPGIDPRLGLDGTVAVRLPGPCLAAELCRAFGRPVTATSANPPGEPPATDADDVRQRFAAELSAGRLHVLGDRAPGGMPSSVVVIRAGAVAIVREGAISAERISRALAGSSPHV